MSLRDDMEVLGRHIENGTAQEFVQGTAAPLPREPWPSDPTAQTGLPLQTLIRLRGD